MNDRPEAETRDSLPPVWIGAGPAVRAFASISSFADTEDMVQKNALTGARRFDEYDAKRSFEGWAPARADFGDWLNTSQPPFCSL